MGNTTIPVIWRMIRIVKNDRYPRTEALVLILSMPRIADQFLDYGRAAYPMLMIQFLAGFMKRRVPVLITPWICCTP
jgi:hypothetical protein